MVDHRSKDLPECGPTEYPATEPCYVCTCPKNQLQFIIKCIIAHNRKSNVKLKSKFGLIQHSTANQT